MLLRGCLDFLSTKQNHLRWPVAVLASQTASWFSSASAETPLPPKRSVHSAWALFVKENYANFKKENPGGTKSEYLSKLYDKFLTADEATRARLNRIVDESRRQYFEAKSKYESSLPAEETQVKSNQDVVSLKRKHKKALKALGMPVRPANPYLLFAKDYSQKNNLNQRLDYDVLGKAWSSLPTSERLKWQESYNLKFAEYKQKLSEWEADMIEKGHLEVIRIKP